MTKKTPLFLDRHPGEILQFCLFGLCFIWHTNVLLLAMLFYFLAKSVKLTWPTLLVMSLILLSTSCLIDIDHTHHLQNLTYYLKDGYRKNVIFWKLLIKYNVKLAYYYEYRYALKYFISIPLLLGSIFLAINKLLLSPHRQSLQDLQKGRLPINKEISVKKLQRKLKALKDENENGTVLGLSKFSGQSLLIPDAKVNQMVLVLGTTGAGKSVTLQRFYHRAISQGYPLLLIDGKPEDKTGNYLSLLAERYQRHFYSFNWGRYDSYHPFSQGNSTELKDKIITLKDQWESDYYRSIAEDYLQTAIEVLIKLKMGINLDTIAACLDYHYLAKRTREANDEVLIERVKTLQQYERSALTGLQAHLNGLAHSALGNYLNSSTHAFNLSHVVNEASVVYFALPALQYPSFAKSLGKLVVNDIKTTIEHRQDNKPIFILFDEFSVFAGEQVLNLVNMGRGKGIHAVFGTQGLADLSKISTTFQSQLLNCVNTVICHRLNDSVSAECISNWAGTKNSFDITSQFGSIENKQPLGSINLNKEFIVHPDEIKMNLRTGEAFFISKGKQFQFDKVMIKH